MLHVNYQCVYIKQMSCLITHTKLCTISNILCRCLLGLTKIPMMPASGVTSQLDQHCPHAQ